MGAPVSYLNAEALDLLRRALDILRRQDLEYCESHELIQSTEHERDQILEEIEDFLET
jgi:hypothetical protein